MKVLAMETSTLLGGVAVVIDGEVVAQESMMRQRSHSEIINIYTDLCLKKASLNLSNIDVFATGHGPGSFTGIRVAANAAKTYAYSFDKPIVTLDTLYLMAVAAKVAAVGTDLEATILKRPILAIVNAYKNMVYFGLFDHTETGVTYRLGPLAVPVRDLAEYLQESVTVVGDGYLDYREYIPENLLRLMNRDSRLGDYPTASTLGICAEEMALSGHTLDWNSFRPLYIRASEAEEKKKGILIKPLI